MPRLNIERQKDLEPKRLEKACNEIEKLGFPIIYKDSTKITFPFKGGFISFFPYSGWATGNGIKDGRGLKNLLKQLV